MKRDHLKRKRETMGDLRRWRSAAMEELQQLRKQLTDEKLKKEQHYRELGCLLGRKQVFDEVAQLLYPLIGKWMVDGRQDRSRLEDFVSLAQKLREASINMWNLYNEKDR